MGSPLTVLVGRRESFNAAHQLRDPGLSDEENRRLFGKCVNLHGHNYVLDVVVAGHVDEASGYVLDLKQLSSVVCRQIVQHVDHRNLNTDVPWLEGRIPTAENLALAFWKRLEDHLDGVGRSLSSPFCEHASSDAADNLDAGMGFEPGGKLLARRVVEQIDHLMPLKSTMIPP